MTTRSEFNYSIFLRTFDFFNEYPLFPALTVVCNLIAILPIMCLLYISHIAPLHSNCRYILCVWALSFGVIYAINLVAVKLDWDNPTGYMPLGLSDPPIRFKLYKVHVIMTTFCSMFEIVLSLERIFAVIKPRQYHFSTFSWKTLVCITLLLLVVSYITDSCVHGDGQYIVPGCIFLVTIEIAILASGGIASKICGIRYKRMYGKSALSARYQVKEAYEMSKAMVPAYIISFILKAAIIVSLCVYLVHQETHGYTLGYLQVHYFTTNAINGSFSMIILLLKHPNLRKQTIRKLRMLCYSGKQEEVSGIRSTTSDRSETDVYFAMLAVNWK